MAFKMNGWSAFKDDDNKEKEGANFMSYGELEKSDLWKRAKPGDKYTYWDVTSDCPDCPERKVVQTAVKRR